MQDAEQITADHPLFLFNCEPEDVWKNNLRSSGAMKHFLVHYQHLGVPKAILVLSERPLDATRHTTVADQLRHFASESLEFSVVSQCYADGVVDKSAPLTGETVGDNTQRLPWPDDTFDLILGRSVVCLCETNQMGGPCGVPCQLTQFLLEVARVLKPTDNHKHAHQALLHGDKTGGSEHCVDMWCEAAREIPQHIHVSPLMYESRFRGLKITKTLPLEAKR